MVQSPDGTHYISDPGSKLSESLSPMGRPSPYSEEVISVNTTLGSSLTVQRRQVIPCGERSQQRLVVCLDSDFQIPASDQLEVMAFVRKPARYRAGSPMAYRAMETLLKERTSHVTGVWGAIDGTCTGQCAYRITLERSQQ